MHFPIRYYAAGGPEKKRTPKINITFNEEEDSKYDGGPLIKPKIPYQFQVKQMNIDPKWSLV